MPRYIDADELLARYKERCAGCKETKNYCEHCCDIADVICDIEDAPFIDIVWCAECKFYNQRGSCFLRFTNLALIDKNNFCSCGRREKTDAEIH